MLAGCRALDLTGQQGMFCGYLLAHLGCEVLAVEPRGGSPARRLAPLGAAGEDGLWWQAYARGKQSIELDLGSAQDRERLLELAADADFLLHSWTETDAQQRGLDYAGLAARNPRLIVVAITPFGANGPKADWPATDLTVWAASGAHILAGDADRAPVRTSVPQSFLHAGADAAGGALLAHHERQRSGRGQHVDVSAQQSCAQAALAANLALPNNNDYEVMREAGGLKGLFPIRLTWPCKDGYMAITLLFGPSFDLPTRRLLEWLNEHDACTREDVETDWGLELAAMARGEQSPQPYFDLCRKIEEFTLRYTQQELFEEGLARGVYIAPTFDVAGLLDEPHFEARDFWHVAAPGASRVPGAFARLSASPLRLPQPAPRLGEHGDLARPARAESITSSADELPLAGLKVLDFMWVIAGPFFTRALSDYGATVIRVESSQRLDPARGAPTFLDGEPGVEHGIPFANFNAGKMGITIDLSSEAGRGVILDLVRWADVVTESFSPKAMKAWGLDYASLKAVNPDLIMLSSCLMGQSGPRSLVPGYGNMAAALTGFYDLTGWQDRSPAGPYLAYTDGVSPRFMLISLLAALEHKRNTGEGQYIDISQAEAAIHLLAPAVLDYELNGRVWHRMGNRDLELAPHGVYPAQGEDEWVAIACQTDEAWVGLSALVGIEQEQALADAAGRRARHDEIDAYITAWSASLPAAEAERQLIEAGVAAHRVLNSAAALADAQMVHREHFVRVPHASLGELVVEGPRFKLSRTPGRVERAGPELGEHNFAVLKDILGYDDDHIADLYAALAME